MPRSRCSRLMYLVVDCAILSQDDTSRWRARASWRRLCGSGPAAQRFSGRLGVWGDRVAPALALLARSSCSAAGRLGPGPPSAPSSAPESGATASSEVRCHFAGSLPVPTGFTLLLNYVEKPSSAPSAPFLMTAWSPSESTRRRRRRLLRQARAGGVYLWLPASGGDRVARAGRSRPDGTFPTPSDQPKAETGRRRLLLRPLPPAVRTHSLVSPTSKRLMRQ